MELPQFVCNLLLGHFCYPHGLNKWLELCNTRVCSFAHNNTP